MRDKGCFHNFVKYASLNVLGMLGLAVGFAVCFLLAGLLLSTRIISLLRGFVLILPMAFALSAGFGMTGVWCAVPVTEALVAGVGALYWSRGDRQMLVRT